MDWVTKIFVAGAIAFCVLVAYYIDSMPLYDYTLEVHYVDGGCDTLRVRAKSRPILRYNEYRGSHLVCGNGEILNVTRFRTLNTKIVPKEK